MAVVMLTGVTVATSVEVYADEGGSSCNGAGFFGLRPWYQGLTTNGCQIGTPGQDGVPELPVFVWTIVLNILSDITVMIGYIAIVIVAWGGYLYMFSRGMPDRAEKGKKTLIAAVIGLIISMLASVIMNTIVSILTTKG